VALSVARPAVTSRPPAVHHFARLKLRILRNGLRGDGWKITKFVAACVFGVWEGLTAFAVFAVVGLDIGAGTDVAYLVFALGGAVIVLGWLFLPLVFFGVDETLDPARFALLPVPRRTLVGGLFLSGLIGVPAAATLLATAGMVIAAAAHGGLLAGATQVVGVIAGLLLCVALSRALTSGFATMLRSRRNRDMAAILLAVLVALIGPLEIAIFAATDRADFDQAVTIARAIGWTPFGAPYTAGLDVAEGHPIAAVVKLAGTAALIWALLAWWARSLETAMVGTATPVAARPERRRDGGPTAQLFPRVTPWLRPDRYGALVAREVGYWWRDARRRANLVTIGVIGVFVPLMVNVGVARLALGDTDATPSPATITWSMLFVGTLAALTLANQFGFDGTAYALHVIVGVPGRMELRARVVAFSVYIVPMLTAIAVIVALAMGQPGSLTTMLGGLYAAYGAGIAVNLYVSILAAYALPETSNPFAISTGSGVAKSMFAFLALIATLVICVPLVVAAAVLDGAWVWLALPVGLAYGLGLTVLGCYLAGDLLDRRAPELLRTVTPNR
jgi:ABC-2 type transport system permease protein